MPSRTRSPGCRPLHSPTPPPSKSLLKLQNMGLEYPASSSNSSLTLPAKSESSLSVTDLNKPLPREPREPNCRSSSVYSSGTAISDTISDIIRLYGGDEKDKDDLGTFTFHQPQAYRDTLVPLLDTRMSFKESPLSNPDNPETARSLSLSEPAHRLHEYPRTPLVTDHRTAPTFAEFSKNLRNRRHEAVSPLSTTFIEQHRRFALDQLAPPSPQTPRYQPAPPISQQGNRANQDLGITQPSMEADLVPAPLNFNRMSPERASVDSMSTNSFIIYTGVGEVLKAKIKEKLQRRKGLDARDHQRAKLDAETRQFSAVEYADTIGHGDCHVDDLSRAHNRQVAVNGQPPVPVPRRQKQLAIPLTPYQKYGIEVWFAKNKKQRAKERQARRAEREQEGIGRVDMFPADPQRRHSAFEKATELKDAYHSGQNQLVEALEGARHRLRRSSSERRRERLKKSITLIGPTVMVEGRNTMLEPRRWI